jgi:hypothetical protein
MGAGGASTGGGGGSPNQMAKDKAEKDRIAAAKTKDKFGYTKPKSKFKTFIEGGGVIGAVTKPFRDASEEVNRKFYEEKVVPAGKSKAANYETYMKDRLAGKTDAYGNPTPNQGGGNDNNTPAPTIIKKTAGGQTIQTTAPTEAELSQSAAADAEEYDLRKTKKRGRSMMLLTGPQGLSKDDKLTLGKPSLLGS